MEKEEDNAVREWILPDDQKQTIKDYPLMAGVYCVNLSMNEQCLIPKAAFIKRPFLFSSRCS